MERFPHLFRPIRLGSLELKNRFMFGPHASHLADYQTGFVTDRQIAYMSERARGGAAMMVLGASPVHRAGYKRIGFNVLFSRDAMPGLVKLGEAIHQYDCRIFAQLHQSGRQATSDSSRVPLFAPSPIPCPTTREVPHGMDDADIQELIEAYANGAAMLQEAGFDGAEVYCAHGYLLGQYLSPHSNKRTDRYGGSMENRCRIVDEIIRAVRKRVGDQFPLGLRISADELIPDGLKVEEVVEICKHFEAQHSLAYFSQSMTNYSSHWHSVPDMSHPHNVFVPYAALLKQHLKTPMVAVGRIVDPVEAEHALASGQADVINMVRALIADPFLPNKARDGTTEKIYPCIGCNEGCAGRMAKGLPISCVVNPAVTEELSFSPTLLTVSKQPKRVLVVGGGPAGLKAAETLLIRGHQVTLWEKGRVGGQVALASQAPNRAELADLIRPLVNNIERLGGELATGRAATVENVVAFAPDLVVVATGSKPVMPDCKTENSKVQLLTYEEAFKGITGKKVIVADGGEAHWKCCSTAELLASRGHEVTVVTPVSYVGMEIEPKSRHLVLKRLRAGNVRFMPMRAIQSVSGSEVTVRDTLSSETEVIANVDAIVFTWYNQADNQLYYQLQGKVPQIYAVGDALAPRKMIDAVYDGYTRSFSI